MAFCNSFPKTDKAERCYNNNSKRNYITTVNKAIKLNT